MNALQSNITATTTQLVLMIKALGAVFAIKVMKGMEHFVKARILS